MASSAIIRRCATLAEAQICAALLREHGQHATIDNEHHSVVDWSIVPALGGVAVRVPKSQYEASKEIIISSAQNGPAILEAQFGPYDAPSRTRRIRAWTMLLIWFGLAQLAGGFLLFLLDKIIPPQWIPDPDPVFSVYYYGYVGGIPPASGGENGLLLMIMVVAIVLYELANMKQTSKEPSV